MDVVVTGIGLISALGSLELTWQSLLAGKSGIRYHQPFPELGLRPLALIGHRPATLTALTHTVVAAAIADAGLTLPLPECAIAIGSSRGNQALWEQLAKYQGEERGERREETGGGRRQKVEGKGQKVITETQRRRDSIQNFHPSSLIPPQSGSKLHPSSHCKAEASYILHPSPLTPHPSHSSWLDTLPHAAAIVAARQIQTTAMVSSPMAACATGLWSIAQGAELIRTGQYTQVLAGAVEAPITPLTLAGFAQMGALAQTGAYPFDRDREGLVLAEGGAVLVLEAATSAMARGAKIYGQILGAGLTADGYHVSAPEPKSRSAIAAVQQCLTRSGLTCEDIDYIHAHGTATLLNDRNEAHLIQALLPQGVAVGSTKGATGHAIGASGALGAAFCLMALRHQILPPCVGLTQPEFALNFVRQPVATSIETALCLNFGFGGQNAAIAFAAESR